MVSYPSIVAHCQHSPLSLAELEKSVRLSHSIAAPLLARNGDRAQLHLWAALFVRLLLWMQLKR